MHETSNRRFALPRLQLLGMSSHKSNDVALTRLGHKPLILLTRLILELRPISRETLMAFLWPEASETRARGSLRQALHVLRETVGEECLATDRRAVGLRSAPLCDLADFLGAVRANEWCRAALLYGGTLLEGVTVTDATDAELWLDFERRRVRKLFETAAAATLEDFQSGTTSADRLEVARRLRDQNPRQIRSWKFLYDELIRSGTESELRMEQAALSAQLETGQIVDVDGAMQVLDSSRHTRALTLLQGK